MGSVDSWEFESFGLLSDGRYLVVGRLKAAREYDGTPASTGLGFDQSGMLVGPVQGYGATPEAAREDAIYKAGADDERRRAIIWNAQVSVMRGW